MRLERSSEKKGGRIGELDGFPGGETRVPKGRELGSVVQITGTGKKIKFRSQILGVNKGGQDKGQLSWDGEVGGLGKGLKKLW